MGASIQRTRDASSSVRSPRLPGPAARADLGMRRLERCHVKKIGAMTRDQLRARHKLVQLRQQPLPAFQKGKSGRVSRGDERKRDRAARRKQRRRTKAEHVQTSVDGVHATHGTTASTTGGPLTQTHNLPPTSTAPCCLRLGVDELVLVLALVDAVDDGFRARDNSARQQAPRLRSRARRS